MRLKYSCIFILSFAFFIQQNPALCQNQPSFEQYHFNQLVINPAYAGSRGNVDVSLFSHNQWIRFNGAPSTKSLCVHAQIADGKIGLGAKLLADNIGVTDKYQLAIDYAYRMYTNSGVLAIGIEAGLSYYSLAYYRLDGFLNNDPAFTLQPEQFWSPNAGAGIYFHNDKFYAGGSVPVLFENSSEKNLFSSEDSNQIDLFEASRHYYVTTGYLLNITDNFSLKPYTLIKYVPAAPVQVDASLSFIFYDLFWLGGSYRTSNSISLMAEYFFKRKSILNNHEIGFGYAYNFSLSNLQSTFGPTHELFLSYNFNKKNTRIKSPRFF